MLPSNVETYLSKYAVPGWEVESGYIGSISTAVVIPAIREYEKIRILLDSLADNDKTYFGSTLIIFVINNSSSPSAQIIADNTNSINLLNSIIENNPAEADSLVKKVIASGLKIGYINASTSGKELPGKDAGVGLARKIGMDLALILLDYNSQYKKILVCLDADCTVDKNYITAIRENFDSWNISAAVVNYKHKFKEGSEEEIPIICYEIFLRYYELGLKFANSPFAFPTIGSTIVCDFESYIKSEGMNKRKAAEDFYFLEKLAKNYKIEKINSTTVYPSARRSWRVPFGTGQRINRFLAGVQDEYLLYDPQSFYILRDWLIAYNDDSYKSADDMLGAALKIDAKLCNFLKEQNFEKDLDRILNNSKTQQQLNRQKNMWFDGFRTLKLIHYLRDNGYPSINMFDALDIMLREIKIPVPEELIKRVNGAVPAIEIQKCYLDILRDALQS